MSELIGNISYRKGGIKERYKDLPWRQLEQLKPLLEQYLVWRRQGRSTEAYHFGLVEIALPHITVSDLPELRERLRFVHDLETLEASLSQLPQLSQFSDEPWGLPNICKLVGYTLDLAQLETGLQHIRELRDGLGDTTVLEPDHKVL